MRSAVAVYGLTLAAVAVAWVARWLFDPWLGDYHPYVTFFVAVAAAAWLGGLRPALLAAVLGLALAWYFFVPTRFSFELKETAHGVGLGAYLMVSLAVAGFGEAMRRAQRRAEERRESLRITLASIGDAVITTDAEGRVVGLNGVAESLTGWSGAEAAGQPLDAVFCIVNEQTRQSVENPAKRALREGLIVGLANHTVLIAKDGAQRPIDDSASPIKDEQGHVAGCVLIFRDVTQKRRAEEALRESEHHFRTLYESMDEGYCVIEVIFDESNHPVDYRFLEINQVFEKQTGIKDAKGRLMRQIAPDHEQHWFDLYGRIALTGETMRFESPAGALGRYFDVCAFPVGPAEQRRVGIVFNDITERKRAEEKLRESERRLAAELEATTRLHAVSGRLLSAGDLKTALDDVLENAIATCSADFGNIQLYNVQLGALEIVVQRGFQKDFLDHFRTVRVDEGSACAQALQAGERILIEDVQLDPSYEPHRRVAAAAGYRAVQSTPLKTHDGVIVGILSTHFRLPHRVSEPDQRMLDLYARHAADLIERLRFEQALQEADRRKNEFLAILSHELRNPLAPICTSLELLRLTGGNGQALERATDMMRRQLRQMVRLIDDLLDVSRISRGKIELKKQRVELASVVSQAVEAARPQCDKMALGLTVTLPPQPVYVNADPVRLAQVVGNLLSNACKFTNKRGQILLTVEAARRGASAAADEAVIRVRDTGIGIPRDQFLRIFEMFTQVDTSLERAQGGLGIGLMLVKHLVEMHDGTVEVHSDGPGQGSEFVVRLPAVAERSQPAPPHYPMRGAQPAVAPRRMVVVDDNRDAAESLAMLLKLTGHEIHLAYDGLEALEAAQRVRPEVMLLDIGMPKVNGYEAARRIREQAWGRDILLIALTGWGQDADKRRTQESGFNGHLVKPVDHAALMNLVAALLRERECQLANR